TDDVLVAVALIMSCFLTATMCEQVDYGMGRHYANLNDHEKIWSLRWFWASVWIYYLALWSVKLSILFQYLRILPFQGYRNACYALMTTVTLWTFWAFFSAVFACTPIDHFWDPKVEGTCLNRLVVWFTNAGVNIVTDIATAILPLPVLNQLRLPAKQKYTLMFVFGLGGLSCLMSILRLQSLYVISKSTDVSWDNPLAAIYSSMEVNIGITCSCLPTLKGLATRVFPKLTFGDSYLKTRSRSRSIQLEAFPSPKQNLPASFDALGFKVPGQEAEATAKVWPDDAKRDVYHIDIDEEDHRIPSPSTCNVEVLVEDLQDPRIHSTSRVSMYSRPVTMIRLDP
ncbi:Satratoxin biosynthesis SC1 cluster protein 4, partial [Pseudocercospora fuligena]